MTENEYNRHKVAEWRERSRHVSFWIKPSDCDRIDQCRRVYARRQGFPMGGGKDELNKFMPLSKFYREAMELLINYWNLDETWDE